MTKTTMDKARLAAFIDGELSPEDAAEVVMHLADHPVDQAYVDELMALNVMIGEAYDAPLHEPVPPALLATIAADGEGGRVVPLKRKAPFVRRYAAWGGGAALAAGIAAFLVIANPGAPDPASIAIGPLPVDSAQSRALSELATGGSRAIGDGMDISVTASFQTAANGVCREFEIVPDDAARRDLGIACPNAAPGGGWRVEAVDAVVTAAAPGSFTPASGDDADPLGDFLDKVGAGRALTPAEEEKARASAWRSAE